MKNILFVFLSLLLLFCSQVVVADTFKVRAGGSANDYSLKNIDSGSTTISTAYIGRNVGISYFTNSSSFFDVAASDGSGTYSESNFTGSVVRSDWSAIWGVRNSEFGYYAGWKNGTTTFTPSTTPITSTQTLDFKADGLIFGGSWSHQLEKEGTVALSLGVGLMDGKYDSKVNGTNASVITYYANQTSGFSFGVSYAYAVSSWLGMSLDCKYNDYNYMFLSGTRSAHLEESVYSTVASIYAAF